MASFLGLGSLPSTRKSLPSSPPIFLEPWEPKTASLPEPPTRISSPLPVASLYPPYIKSLPVPPSRLSVPPNPTNVSLPALPRRLSAPLVPLKVSGHRCQSWLPPGLLRRPRLASQPSSSTEGSLFASFTPFLVSFLIDPLLREDGAAKPLRVGRLQGRTDPHRLRLTTHYPRRSTSR